MPEAIKQDAPRIQIAKNYNVNNVNNNEGLFSFVLFPFPDRDISQLTVAVTVGFGPCPVRKMYVGFLDSPTFLSHASIQPMFQDAVRAAVIGGTDNIGVTGCR